MNWFDKLMTDPEGWFSKMISTPSGFVLSGMLAAVGAIFGVCWIAYMLGGP